MLCEGLCSWHCQASQATFTLYAKLLAGLSFATAQVPRSLPHPFSQFCACLLLARSLTCSLTHSYAHSLARSLTHSLTQSLIHMSPHLHTLISSSTQQSTSSLSASFCHSLTPSLTCLHADLCSVSSQDKTDCCLLTF